MNKIPMLLILSLSSWAFADAPAMLESSSADLNARARVLGPLLTASGEDATSFLSNAAGLAYTTETQIGITYNKLMMDTGIVQFGLLCPLKRAGIGVSFTQFSGGTIQLPGANNIVNGNNLADGMALDLGATRSLTAQSDQCLSVSYGREILPGVSLGLAGKYVRSELLDQYTAQSVAVDGGILWKTPYRGLMVGAGVYNAGTPVKYRDTYESMPIDARLGATIPLRDTSRHAWMVGAGLDVHRGATVGSEYIFDELLAMRASYGFEKNTSYVCPLSVGVGFFLKQNQFDYMWSTTGVEDLHQISCSFHFGPGGSFGKGKGYYKKGMFAAARASLAKVPAGDPRYAEAQNLIKLCSEKIASGNLLDMTQSIQGNSKKYPATVKIMKYIPTAIYNLLPDRNIMPCSVAIKNNTSENAEFLVKCKFDFQTDENVVRLEIPPGREKAVNIYPVVPSPVGARVITQNMAGIRVQVYVGDGNKKYTKIMDDINEPVLFQPNNQYFAWIKNALGEKNGLSDTLAAWVTPNDPSMVNVLARAGERAAKAQITISGGQDARIFLKSAELVDVDMSRQIEVIYTTLLEDYHTAYLNQPILDIRDGQFASQRVKYPADTLRHKGNCIELSVLFASLLESIGINPIIMLMPGDGHCIVGWEVPRSDKNMYRLLETNQFGRDFNTVSKSGLVWLQKYGLEEIFANAIPFDKDGVFEDGNVVILNVGAVRRRIPPSLYAAGE